jgi:hypothetical protein
MAADATINKSQAIRDYLKKNKKAMPTAVAGRGPPLPPAPLEVAT